MRRGCEAFSISKLKDAQSTAIKHVLHGSDVFASFPTGFGKSMVYFLLPLIAKSLQSVAAMSTDSTPFPERPCVLVVSPLRALIEDQVSYLRKHGLMSAILCRDDAAVAIDGEYSIIFGSPESWPRDGGS